MSPSPAPVEAQWHRLLMDAELAKRHPQITMFASGPAAGPAPRNPTLDALLPALLYIRLGAFLDGTFADHIAGPGWGLGKPSRGNFDSRITFLTDRKLLTEPTPVRALRARRNDLAHAAEPTLPCTWQELNAAIETAQAALEDLGLVGPRPQYEFYGESRPRDTPTGADALSTLDYRYGLKVDGRKVTEVGWAVSILRGR